MTSSSKTLAKKMSKFSADLALAVRQFLRQDQNYVMSQITKGGHGAIFGKVRWVMKAADTAYDEFLASHPAYEDTSLAVFTTITTANAALEEGDVMIIGPGSFAEGGLCVTVDTANVKILGSGMKGNGSSTRMHNASGSVTLLEIDAAGVEVAYINFVGQSGVTSVGIEVAPTAICYGVHIHHCFFQASVTNRGIAIKSVTRDAPDLIVEHCYFHMGYRATQLYATRAIIRYNDFNVMEDCCAIYHEADTSARANTMIYGNNFMAHDTGGGQYGINVVNTPTVGYLYIHMNTFVNFADATHAITKGTGYVGLNFYNSQYLVVGNPPTATNLHT